METRARARYATVGGLVATVLLFAPGIGTLGPFAGGLTSGALAGGSDRNRVIVGAGTGAVTLGLIVAVLVVLRLAGGAVAAVPILGGVQFFLEVAIRSPSFVLFGLVVLPVVGAWVGGFLRSVVVE